MPRRGTEWSIPRERGTAALIRFEDHACDVLRFDPLLAQRALEAIKGGVRGAEAVGEGDLHEAGVQVHDPLLQFRDAAGQLLWQADQNTSSPVSVVRL